MDIVERMKAMLDAGDAVGGISRVFVPADDVRDLLAEIERLRSLSEPVAYMVSCEGSRYLQWGQEVADSDRDLVTIVPLYTRSALKDT